MRPSLFDRQETNVTLAGSFWIFIYVPRVHLIVNTVNSSPMCRLEEWKKNGLFSCCYDHWQCQCSAFVWEQIAVIWCTSEEHLVVKVTHQCEDTTSKQVSLWWTSPVAMLFPPVLFPHVFSASQMDCQKKTTTTKKQTNLDQQKNKIPFHWFDLWDQKVGFLALSWG